MTGVKKNINKTHEDVRSFKLKQYSIGSVILLVCIVLVVNILLDRIFGKSLTFDFSDYNQNTISKESEDYLNSLSSDAKIRIVGLFDRPDNVSGTPYQYILPLLDDYARKSNGRVSVEYVNPITHPMIISELDPSNAHDLSSNNDSFVIAYNGKIKVIRPIDCYSYNVDYYYRTGDYLVVGNNTEYVFTNTMNALTQGYSCKAYFITGLKEEGNEYLSKIMESMSFECEELPVSENFAVPEDCDVLVLNGPNNDISEKVYVSLTDYVNHGGKLLISVNFSMKNVAESYERLNKLLNQINVSIDPALISENNPGYQLNGYSQDSAVIVTDAFKDFSNISLLHSTNARSVRCIENPNSGFKTYPVLVTSDNASTYDIDQYGNAIESSLVENKRFNVAVLSESEETGASVFVFGTTNFTSDEYISAYGLNDSNVDFIKSCFRDLTSSKQLNVLNITTKSVDDFSIDTSKATSSSSTAVLICFMIVVPVAFVALAVIVYTKRKNL